jgi:hypothetical protein
MDAMPEAIKPRLSMFIVSSRSWTEYPCLGKSASMIEIPMPASHIVGQNERGEMKSDA